MKCNYCEKEAKLVNGLDIYPHRADLQHKKFWQCIPCGAYVGCHKPNNGYGDGTVPLGDLANKKDREWRVKVHNVFDPIWKNSNKCTTRKDAYRWLAKSMDIDLNECHISKFDYEQCKLVIDTCASKGK